MQMFQLYGQWRMVEAGQIFLCREYSFYSYIYFLLDDPQLIISSNGATRQKLSTQSSTKDSCTYLRPKTFLMLQILVTFQVSSSFMAKISRTLLLVTTYTQGHFAESSKYFTTSLLLNFTSYYFPSLLKLFIFSN